MLDIFTLPHCGNWWELLLKRWILPQSALSISKPLTPNLSTWKVTKMHMAASGEVNGNVPGGIGLRVLNVFSESAVLFGKWLSCFTSHKCLSYPGQHFLGHINDEHTESDIFYFELAIIYKALCSAFLSLPHINRD